MWATLCDSLCVCVFVCAYVCRHVHTIVFAFLCVCLHACDVCLYVGSVKFTCQIGSIKVSGAEERICLINGTLTGSETVCKKGRHKLKTVWKIQGVKLLWLQCYRLASIHFPSLFIFKTETSSLLYFLFSTKILLTRSLQGKKDYSMRLIRVICKPCDKSATNRRQVLIKAKGFPGTD